MNDLQKKATTRGAPILQETMIDPVVTVVIPTFNHIRWIEETIKSVLMQHTRAPTEILVSEDASTDGTARLIESLALLYPNRIRTIFSERNVRSNEVVARGLRAARGRYVCLLDGDDYWTDPTKLQRQADFLDEHPECSAIFYNALVVEGDQVRDRRWTRADLPTRLDEDKIWEGNPFATCTGMMRTTIVREVPEWYADFFPITDWPLYVLCAKRGLIAFSDEICGAYRLHLGGNFSSLGEMAKRDSVEAFYRRMIRLIEPSSAIRARRGYSRYFFDWAQAHMDAGDLAAARDCFRRSMRASGVGRGIPWHAQARLGLSLLLRSALQTSKVRK